MAFQYDPKDAVSAWPEGEYDASLSSVEETVSKSSGAPMLKVLILVHGKGGKKRKVYEYITAKGVFKLRAIAKAFGDEHYKLFKAGDFDLERYVGASLRVRLEVEEDSQFGDRNRIGEYVSGKPPKDVLDKALAGEDISGDLEDDDIPF